MSNAIYHMIFTFVSFHFLDTLTVLLSIAGEGICSLRKLGIIMLSAFAHDFSLQLHFTSLVLVAAFAVHSIYLPFQVEPERNHSFRMQNNGRATFASILHLQTVLMFLLPCSAKIISPGNTLHRMERNSILICTFTWSGCFCPDSFLQHGCLQLFVLAVCGVLVISNCAAVVGV